MITKELSPLIILALLMLVLLVLVHQRWIVTSLTPVPTKRLLRFDSKFIMSLDTKHLRVFTEKRCKYAVPLYPTEMTGKGNETTLHG